MATGTNKGCQLTEGDPGLVPVPGTTLIVPLMTRARVASASVTDRPVQMGLGTGPTHFHATYFRTDIAHTCLTANYRVSEAVGLARAVPIAHATLVVVPVGCIDVVVATWDIQALAKHLSLQMPPSILVHVSIVAPRNAGIGSMMSPIQISFANRIVCKQVGSAQVSASAYYGEWLSELPCRVQLLSRSPASAAA